MFRSLLPRTFTLVSKHTVQVVPPMTATARTMHVMAAPMRYSLQRMAGVCVPKLAQVQWRGLAKKAGKGKEKAAAVSDEAGPTLDTAEYAQLMRHAVDAVHKDFDKIRTGQTTPAILDHIRVSAYGSPVPISQIGQVSLKDPTNLIVSVFDPELLKTTEEAIRQSDLGLNPVFEGKVIRVPMPKLTKEHRTNLTKLAKETAEGGKQRVRRVRTKALTDLKKIAKAMSKDDERAIEKELQTFTDNAVKEIDDLLAKKTKAIMG